jgi:hypothetical protein
MVITTPRNRSLGRLLVAAVLVAGGLVAGIGWSVWWVIDQLGSPGPAATGSGPCTTADSVNIELVFADQHTVRACTHDRPACQNQAVAGTMNGQTGGASLFTLSNQLRSSSRRYFLFVRFDAGLPAEASEQTLQLNGLVGMIGLPGVSPPGGGTLSAAVLQITPRDPDESGFTAVSGTLTVSSAHGVAQGRIDGSFINGDGSPRPDRPVPTPADWAVRITGTFACSR